MLKIKRLLILQVKLNTRKYDFDLVVRAELALLLETKKLFFLKTHLKIEFLPPFF